MTLTAFEISFQFLVLCGVWRQGSHFFHAESLVLLVNYILAVLVLGHFDNLMGNFHVRKALQQLHLPLDQVHAVNDWRAVSPKGMWDDCVVPIAEIASNLTIRPTVVLGRSQRWIVDQLGQFLQDLVSRSKSTLAQIAQGQLVGIIGHI